MRLNFRWLLAALCLLLTLCCISCDCGDDDDDDSGGDDDAADDDAADDDTADDDAGDDDAADDDAAPTELGCIPPLDYDGDGDPELLLSVWLTDINTQRLHLVEPGTFERGSAIVEYDVTGGAADFQVADFDGNGVWDIVATIESAASGTRLGWYDVFMNGDFTEPAHVFGPFGDTSVAVTLVDTDGNGRPEMMIRVENSDKGSSPPPAFQLIDSDNDFAEIATMRTPDSAPGASLRFLPEQRVGSVWPSAGAVTSADKANELLAYAIYTEAPDYYLRLFVFDAADGSLVAESDPYYLGESASNNSVLSGDFDGDGLTEAVIGISEEIAAPESHTAYLYIVGGPTLATEWSQPATADAYAVAGVEGDYNLDGWLDPTVGYSAAAGNDNTRQILNGADDYATLFELEYTNDDPLSLLTRLGRGYLDFGFNYRGLGTEIFTAERSILGAVATGQLRAISMDDGSLSGTLQEFDLGEDGSFGGVVVDLSGDGVLDLVVRYTERYQSGGEWTEIVFYEVMTAPDFYEVLHEEMPSGYHYYYDTTLDLTGDSAPDLLVMRQNDATLHEDYLLFVCDADGCDEPVQIDYEADEQFFFIGPML